MSSFADACGVRHRRAAVVFLTSCTIALTVLCCGVPREACAEEDNQQLTVIPAEIELRGPVQRHRVLVEWQTVEVGGEAVFFTGEAMQEATLESSDPAVAVVEDGFVIPQGNGTATITATLDGAEGTATITVTGFEKPFVWSFRNHVQSVLTKTGCNSGACHGAAAGKNGFKLSLRGYDIDGDFAALTRHALGRRIVPSDPARSLILLKPTGAIAHGGGFRFDVGSPEYQVVAEWIAAGTPRATPFDPRIEHIEVLPAQTVLATGDQQQLIVRAHFSNGHVEDVTRWAKFESTNGSVAEVDNLGLVRISGEGEGAISVWYLSRVETATITVPYQREGTEDSFAAAPRRNFIDDLVLEKLAQLNIPPSPRASDSEFLRRAYLDTIGTLPTVEESRAFLADQSADKRDRVIDALLSRPEFVDYWTYKWSELLLVNSAKLPAPAMWAFSNWVRNHVAANTPWNVMVRKLVTSTGSTLENGATNFFVLHPDPTDMSETVSQAFLGMSINCAKCHNHPLEKWTNNQYYAMANLFARVRLKNASGIGNQLVFAASDGDLVQPLTGSPQPPTPLDGEALPIESLEDRREHLADWLVSPENPYFARAVTNRVWANFFGVGLVEAVDDLRLTNPASNAELLAALSQHLVDNEFDLRALMRMILQSETYQRTSEPLKANAADTRFYARYYPKRLMAEVLLDAIAQVTDVPTEFPGYPSGWRAVALPDSNVDSYFLQTFGRPDRTITCACERSDEPSMVQVLHLANGDAINDKLAAENNRIAHLLSANLVPTEIIEEAYLSALCRLPSEREASALAEVFAATPPEEMRLAVEDLFWSLLSSKEFLFNH